MIELVQYAFGIILIGFMGYGCWISTVMLSERSRLRKITGEYYDFDIDAKLQVTNFPNDYILIICNMQFAARIDPQKHRKVHNRIRW